MDTGPDHPRPAFGGLSEFDPAGSLATRQVEEMVAAWRRGERPPAEEFLLRHPGLGDEAAIRLIFEEFCLRLEAGLEVEPAEIGRRFPRWRAELEALLDCRRLMVEDADPVALPGPGEELAEFRLLDELGRGVAGRVFLAAQPGLADRPVVLKVTPCGRDEHLSLARLQHMNIVPLYSAQVLPGRRLRVLCMPFLGGASLAQVLAALGDRPADRRTGRQLVEALDRLQARLPVSSPTRGPFRDYIAGSPYVEAVCWIGICLADGLQFAHDHGFVHMDVKPSNVLIAGDGQPMLLDFHLARGPLAPSSPAPARLGGTPAYMAPEQSAALAAVGEGRAIVEAVDGRADIYSLGMLLHEALGGSRPVAGPLHRRNPRVSMGLSDIIHKCLRPDPRDRYADAAALAADLRRHLENLPLREVPNRSPAERWRKWRRRRPQALTRGMIVLAAAVATSATALLAGFAYRQRVREVESALASGGAYLDRRQYPEAAGVLKQGLALAQHLPGADRARQALGEGLAHALRAGKAEDLHRLVELLRFRYGIDPPPPEEARALIRRGRDIWQARGSLLGARAGPEDERATREDLLDFALVWADLRLRSASPGEVDQARGEALGVLTEAEELLGPSPAIDRERRAYSGGPGGPSTAPTPAPRSAREHYDLGRSYLRSGEVALAAEQFRLGLDLRPQDFWLNFFEGLCGYRLGRFDDAADAFRVCIALSPGTAECYYSRALALAALGRPDRAIDDYTRALDRNPALTAAALNRGLLHYQAGRLDQSAADLGRALATSPDRALRGIIRYNLALVALARGDRDAARSNARASADSGNAEARRLLESLGR